MTKRDALNTIVGGEVTEEVKSWAAAEIEKMDKANEARRNRVSKKAQENAPIVEAIEAVLGEEPKTATEIGAEVGVSTQKASALLRQIVEAGNAVKTDVKVKGKGTQKGYTAA